MVKLRHLRKIRRARNLTKSRDNHETQVGLKPTTFCHSRHVRVLQTKHCSTCTCTSIKLAELSIQYMYMYEPKRSEFKLNGYVHVCMHNAHSHRQCSLKKCHAKMYMYVPNWITNFITAPIYTRCRLISRAVTYMCIYTSTSLSPFMESALPVAMSSAGPPQTTHTHCLLALNSFHLQHLSSCSPVTYMYELLYIIMCICCAVYILGLGHLVI